MTGSVKARIMEAVEGRNNQRSHHLLLHLLPLLALLPPPLAEANPWSDLQLPAATLWP